MRVSAICQKCVFSEEFGENLSLPFCLPRSALKFSQPLENSTVLENTLFMANYMHKLGLLKDVFRLNPRDISEAAPLHIKFKWMPMVVKFLGKLR